MKNKCLLCVSLVVLVASFAVSQDREFPEHFSCGSTARPTLSVEWAQFHFDAAHTGCNPYETLLRPATVVNLAVDWKYKIGAKPNFYDRSPVVARGAVYLGSEGGYLHALTAATGAPLWSYK